MIVINGLLISFGTKHMVSGLKWVNGGAAIGLVFLVYGTQKKIWQHDMEGKRPKIKVKTEIVRDQPFVAVKECS